MTKSPIRIGFIGLNPDSHWAAMAHVPALRALSDEFEIVGVANSSAESSRRTATALNLPYAFDSVEALISSDVVDLVVVTVKVPYHFELVTAVLEAGKHVHCEWPLANGLHEARKLTTLAQEKGVVATVGTQMCAAPEIRYLKSLVADGYVGEVLSTTLVGDGGNWGAETSAELSYLFDKTNGATLQAIPFAHTLAGLKEVLGDFAQVTGRLIKRRSMVHLIDAKKDIPRSAEDQVMVHGQLESGAAFSAHYRGGLSKGTNFLWEINGTKGDIQVLGNIGHGQFAQMTIKGARGGEGELAILTPPAVLFDGLPDHVVPRNVAAIYALVAQDIRNNTRRAPSFADALRLHEILEEIEGTSQTLG